jgi:hypothetical protein
MSDLVKIPEDLKRLYERAHDLTMGFSGRDDVKRLIERIAQQDAEIDALREQYKTVFEAGKKRYEQVLTLKGLLRECRSWIVGATYGHNEPIDLLVKIDQQLQPKGERG